MSIPFHQRASFIFWWSKFFSSSINITLKLCITQFFPLNTFSFSWDFSAYQIGFISFELWTGKSSVSPFILFSVSEFLIFLNLCMLWMLVTANKEKHKVWHGSHTSQITSWKPLVTQTFFDVSNENVLSLSHTSWVTNHKMFIKKLLVFSPEALTRKRKRRGKKSKAFCVTYKRKKRKGVAKLVAL